ncbi:MAG: PilZ domain-containing protein [Clostridium sp.]|uniref:flagellar brake protein n=1 Tax=Clostridium sp. TaxID=1506 RepID=UPI00290C2E2C|nr:PilZ domain-containing protein [Clostridium sp.]MDU5109261.1 PilZ domain-containing protein [Clostridium sp.]
MSNIKLEMNCVIDILFENNVYKSTIQDVKAEEFLIAVPINDGIFLTLNEGDELQQIIYDGNGNVFGYKSKVLGRYVEEEKPYYRLSLPYSITKIQRRDYVRVDIVQIINYVNEKEIETELKENSKKAEVIKKEKYKNAMILDLSGGGMRVKIKDPIKLNDTIVASLKYEDEEIEVKGEVIRITKAEDRSFVCGVTFVNISNSTREKIIRTVFKIMRKQRELI